METLDWQKLVGAVVPDTQRLPYEPNKHLFRKVAFDVFQLKSGPVDSLWILEEGEDGSSYLVAQYDEESKEKGLEVKSSWSALADKEGKNVTLFYKEMPINRFASSKYGFSNKDAHLFQEALLENLASDETFKKNLLKSLPEEKRNALLGQFPELA